MKKHATLLKEFQKIIRSGKDLSAEAMYEDAGKVCFIEWQTASHIIQKHYRNIVVTEEMRTFVDENRHLEFKELLKLFCSKFTIDKTKICKREGRFILGYIK